MLTGGWGCKGARNASAATVRKRHVREMEILGGPFELRLLALTVVSGNVNARTVDIVRAVEPFRQLSIGWINAISPV